MELIEIIGAQTDLITESVQNHREFIREAISSLRQDGTVSQFELAVAVLETQRKMKILEQKLMELAMKIRDDEMKKEKE